MCLGLVGRVVSAPAGGAIACVDIAGVERDIDVSQLGGAPVVGDYLLVHSGFALERISAERAAEVMTTFSGDGP
jgi:hydrogenase expression/formation protein HypC